MEHSILAPSSANIWGPENGCTGHVLMAQKYPEPDESDAAKEGTIAHEIARLFVDPNAPPRPDNNPDDEMIDGARIYANDILSLGPLDNPDFYGFETKLTIKKVNEICFGTVDAWRYFPAINTIYIWDYKFGHLEVPAEKNYQLICYFSGLRDHLHLPKKTKIVFRIVQPRVYRSSGPISEWTTSREELSPLIGRLAVKAIRSLNPSLSEIVTGPHCRFCYPRYTCPAALQAGMGLYEVISGLSFAEMRPNERGFHLNLICRAHEQLSALKTAYESQIEALIKSGTVVPGWGLEQKAGSLEWIKPREEIISLGKLINIDLEKKGVKTPNQAKKAGVSDDLINNYAKRGPGKTKLTKDDGEKARQVFGGKNE